MWSISREQSVSRDPCEVAGRGQSTAVRVSSASDRQNRPLGPSYFDFIPRQSGTHRLTLWTLLHRDLICFAILDVFPTGQPRASTPVSKQKQTEKQLLHTSYKTLIAYPFRHAIRKNKKKTNKTKQRINLHVLQLEYARACIQRRTQGLPGWIEVRTNMIWRHRSLIHCSRYLFHA